MSATRPTGGNAIGDAGMCALASALAQTGAPRAGRRGGRGLPLTDRGPSLPFAQSETSSSSRRTPLAPLWRWAGHVHDMSTDMSVTRPVGPPVVGAGHALRELGLHNNRIGSRGARALARALAAGGARARRRPTSCAARRVPSHARERRVPQALHTWPSSARAATASGRRPWRSWRALEQGCGQTARRRTRRGEASREVSAGLRDSNLRPCVLQQQLCRLVCAVVCGCIDNLRSLECCR